MLDHELKREYQTWLHERDRDRPDYDGHPDRTDEEIREWADEHDLPYFDDEVHFPDLRIEYRDADDRWDHEDIEITTEHYRGGHASSVARSGFSCFGGSSLRIGGRSSGGGGGGGHYGGLCVKRQYAAFAGLANGGEKCNAFFDKLVRRGFAVTADCIHNRARLYHVQHRALYHAIGDADSRYRRAVPARSAAERLMRLDAALTAPDLDWLTTRSEKVAFLQTMTASES